MRPPPHLCTAQDGENRVKSSGLRSGGKGCPMGPGRGDPELGESWGGWGAPPRGQGLGVGLTSCPGSAPLSIWGAFSLMEELMGKAPHHSPTHPLRDAFNLPAARGLSGRRTRSPPGRAGAPGALAKVLGVPTPPEAGNPQAEQLCSGHFLLRCTARPPPGLGKAQRLDRGGQGPAFLES